MNKQDAQREYNKRYYEKQRAAGRRTIRLIISVNEEIACRKLIHKMRTEGA